MNNDRRNFLVQFGGVTAAAVTTAALIDELAPATSAAVIKDGRGFVAGKFALELDGVSAGWLWSAEGGHATSDVVVEKLGSNGIQKKHLAGVKYEDITIQCGYGLSNPFYDWIKGTFDLKPNRKNGSVILCDFQSRELSRLNFFNALITEIGMPALDAASKDAAKMTIKFTPAYTQRQKGSGQKLDVLPAVQKHWLPSNFRLKIDGLDQATARVNKIDAITIKQTLVENPAGQQRDYQKEPGTVEIPNLVITFPESHADDFYDWHEDFVIKGNNADDKEKGGTLEYLTPNLNETLFKLEFHGLGIFKLSPEKTEAGGENIRRATVEMYCEDIKFVYKPAWV